MYDKTIGGIVAAMMLAAAFAVVAIVVGAPVSLTTGLLAGIFRLGALAAIAVAFATAVFSIAKGFAGA